MNVYQDFIEMCDNADCLKCEFSDNGSRLGCVSEFSFKEGIKQGQKIFAHELKEQIFLAVNLGSVVDPAGEVIKIIDDMLKEQK